MSFATAQYAVDEVKRNMVDQGQTGLPINEMNFVCIPTGFGLEFIFSIDDLVISEELFSRFLKLFIVIKKDSTPSDIEDGILIQEFGREDMHKYATKGYEYQSDILEDGAKYYCRPFIQTDHGVVSSPLNLVQEVIYTKIWIVGFHQDFSDLDPETTISYLPDCVNKDFIPLHANPNSGDFTHGNWDQWPWLSKNKPYMLNTDGSVVYPLDPNDYEKKLDGTASDIHNSSFMGGAFAWFPRLYTKEIYAADGNSRDVYFTDDTEYAKAHDFYSCFKSINSSTSPTTTNNVYHPVNVDVPGYYVAMFYNDNNGKSIWNPENEKAMTTFMGSANDPSILVESAYSACKPLRLGFLNGNFARLIRDVSFLLCKSTDLNTHIGYGFKCNGGKSTAALWKSIPIDYTGGGFLGHSRESMAFAKAFHSYAIATGALGLFSDNPYVNTSSIDYSDGRGTMRLTEKQYIFKNGTYGSTVYPYAIHGADTDLSSKLVATISGITQNNAQTARISKRFTYVPEFKSSTIDLSKTSNKTATCTALNTIALNWSSSGGGSLNGTTGLFSSSSFLGVPYLNTPNASISQSDGYGNNIGSLCSLVNGVRPNSTGSSGTKWYPAAACPVIAPKPNEDPSSLVW